MRRVYPSGIGTINNKVLFKKPEWADAFIAVRMDGKPIREYAARVGADNSFLVTPRIKRSTLVTLSVFPVVGTIVAERKKGIPEDLPQMGNLSESLVFKAFYALLILDP